MPANNPFIVVANNTNRAVVINSPGERIVVQHPGVQGPPGPVGPPGSLGEFIWEQTSPSASWIIVHNLNSYPTVTLIINDEIQFADVSYIDLNSVSIVFPTPFTGKARLL